MTLSNILSLLDALIPLLLAVAAVTPTESDDSVVGRVANLYRKLRGVGGAK